MTNTDILKAMSGIREEFVEDTACAMGYLESKKTGHRKIWRTVLIAAVIAGLLTAAAMASGLLGRKERQAQLPPDAGGQERYTFIPNGFKESPTYKGSLEWWTAFTVEMDENGGIGLEPQYREGDEKRYLISQMYFADSPQMLDTLYGIADKYKLKLYTENLSFSNEQEFYELTGAGKFTDMQLHGPDGYVFDDGSFNAECEAEIEGNNYVLSIHRIQSGSIYPYPTILKNVGEAAETDYMTAKEQGVCISVYPDNSKVISYVSPDGETFIEIALKDTDSAAPEPEALCRRLADETDFKALCLKNDRAGEILAQKRWAEDNRDIQKKIKDFEESSVYMAAKEFQDFFTENFYGFCFTGTYGMEGYADIDAELQRLGDKYFLRFSKEKSEGNEFFAGAICYDNGAWFYNAQEENSYIQYHYIPKAALYTGLFHYTSVDEYKRTWPYETACGETVLLYSDGPDKKSGPYAFYETANAYILVQLSGIDAGTMERAADSIDWTAFK